MIIIDSLARILYASYYIKGIIEVFGYNKIFFKDILREIQIDNYQKKFEQYFALIIKKDNCSAKIVIDYHDSDTIDMTAYNWCDIYAKINLKLSDKIHFKKAQSIAPGFGINIFRSQIKGAILGIKNYIISKGRINLREFIPGYITRKRIGLEEYTRYISNSENNYFFMLSSLWSHNGMKNDVNMNRYFFIRYLKESNIIRNVEGGFVSSFKNIPTEFKDFLYKKPLDIKNYLAKIQKSVFVFNTPAVHNCHGWKFSEYMALGKAMISLPIINELPHPLTHGLNVHFIKNLSDIPDAVSHIKEDSIYRRTIENGAKEYYDKYLKPCNAISNLMKRCDLLM